MQYCREVRGGRGGDEADGGEGGGGTSTVPAAAARVAWWAAARSFAFRLAAPLRFRLPGAGCGAAEEVGIDGEDPVPNVVEGDATSNLILVLPLSVVTARVAWPPLSSILKKSSSKLSTSSLIFSVDI